MVNSRLPDLSFIVINAEKLDSGLSAFIEWILPYGVIGSSPSSEWCLKDAENQVHSSHCEIVMVDGAFCLRDLCGETYINGSDMPIGRHQLAKLGHKDQIVIGPYQVRVIFGDAEGELTAPLSGMFSIKEADLLSDEGTFEVQKKTDCEMPNLDPLAALEQHGNHESPKSLLDPIEHEQGEQSLLDSGVESNTPINKTVGTLQADSDDQISSSMSLKRILSFGFGAKKKTLARDNENSIEVIKPHNNQLTHMASEDLYMDDQTLDLLEEEVAKSIQIDPKRSTTQSSAGHLVTGPMLNGLGAEVDGRESVERMHILSEEIGESLKACIQGLLTLHQHVDEGRFGTLNRNLQPIEDNPLRLGLPYDQTIKTMYGQGKSAVHLSAPAAIEESLANVQSHNEAMQYATSEALNQILGAFSPDVLLKRFNSYKRTSQPLEQSENSWAWDMYCNYYQELTSHRQQGFDKLFWEIFEQAYDRKIREKQLEC